MSDPICGTCGEPKSKHVKTALGPFTHPREATGEGAYVLVHQGHTMGRLSPADDEIYVPPGYKFVRHHDPADAEDSG